MYMKWSFLLNLERPLRLATPTWDGMGLQGLPKPVPLPNLSIHRFITVPMLGDKDTAGVKAIMWVLPVLVGVVYVVQKGQSTQYATPMISRPGVSYHGATRDEHNSYCLERAPSDSCVGVILPSRRGLERRQSARRIQHASDRPPSKAAGGLQLLIPRVIQKFALGKIPTFEDNEGFMPIDGMTIARYG
ncbi:hypothetical protein EDD16DRAFT_1519105 [Pisolithus croceorrhizus]|nr:hypothetical protein EV401DRAFT_1889032 [Pisolithus croceorrhizus]KAI6120161.1 hypothetical protein EDD16DRAFT_1519105 [Pisolithus croceorrhizus]